jgi:hypothetical protein
MPYDFTLPELQARLDALAEGRLLWLAKNDCERLFGQNDVVAARLAHFAQGHGCQLGATVDGIHFRKKLVLEAPRADASA